MARQIQINDFVLVTQSNFAPSTYVIRQIDQNGIYISSDDNPNAFSLLVSDQTGGWKIYGSNEAYTIQFQANPNIIIKPTNIALSGVKEIDFFILSQLDDNSLFNACLINKYVSSLCRDDELWRLKVILQHPGAKKYKSKEKKWRKYYEELKFSGGNANDAAVGGQLDVLQWLEQRNILPDVTGANYTAGRGHLAILIWLAQRKIFPDVTGANNAVLSGHLEVLKWLEQHNILPNVKGANAAAWVGQLEVLEWLEQHNILPDVEGAYMAAVGKRQNVLDWLAKRNIFPLALAL